MKSIGAVALALLCGLIGSEISADQLKLDVSSVRSTLKAGEKQTTWVRVGLDGFKLESEKARPPVNLAIVLDKSGSMQGEKIEQARKAAIDALSLLNSEDIVSIITYDSTVSVLVPATKLSDRPMVEKAIRGINASGNTALFAGVSKGAAEVRKFLAKDRVNRIILLSDGLANVGPSSPGELGSLGASLLKENVSVSTLGLGLGYNEDLMVQLAGSSGGNHHFIEDATELADIFRSEFDDVLSVVAQEVDIRITIPEGLRPVRVLGNSAEINGQQIISRLAQIYSSQNKHLVIEVEIPEQDLASRIELANVSVSYTNMKTSNSDRLSGSTKVGFSDSDQKVQDSLNRTVMADVVALVSSEQNKLATKYLDEGDLLKCRSILQQNVRYLDANALLIPESDRLTRFSALNQLQLEQLDGVTSNKDEKANVTRKFFRSYQNQVDQQQKLPEPK